MLLLCLFGLHSIDHFTFCKVYFTFHIYLVIRFIYLHCLIISIMLNVKMAMLLALLWFYICVCTWFIVLFYFLTGLYYCFISFVLPVYFIVMYILILDLYYCSLYRLYGPVLFIILVWCYYIYTLFIIKCIFIHSFLCFPVFFNTILYIYALFMHIYSLYPECYYIE